MVAVEDFGLVRREQCRCGDVIVVASNASDELLAETLRRHYATAVHRLYGDRLNAYDPSTESALVAPPSSGPGDSRDQLDDRRRPATLVSEPSGALSSTLAVRPDGYDFDVVRRRPKGDTDV